MRRIYFLAFFIGISLPVFSGIKKSHPNLKSIKLSCLTQQPGLDTNRNGEIILDADTTMVLSKDFPMPVDENSHFENDLYKKRLDSLQKQVPLSYNEFVQSYIDLYIYKRRPLIERLLGEGLYYFPIFEKALSDFGVPSELKYLPIIESALNPFAISRVGATGPWQFMYGTGKDYGLKINSQLDERRDPLRSSQAAAHYFKDMFARYGDWLLVIASYNCGKGNVDKAIRKAHGIKDFWAIQRFLPRETRTYVPAFIASSYIMSYANLHGLHMQNPSFSAHPDSLRLDQSVSLFALADNLCVSLDELKRLNPKYKTGLIEAQPEAPVDILIPEGNSSRFAAFLSQLKANPEGYQYIRSGLQDPSERRSFISRLIHHRVRSGETLAEIAGKYSCGVVEIKNWNHLHSNKLYLGQKLKLKQILYVGSTTHSRNIRKTIHYKVRRGDTLESIAVHFNTTIAQLKALNRMHSNLVRTGQSIKLTNRI